MNNKIIGNLFEFWQEIGVANNTYIVKDGYAYTKTKHDTWPSKVFPSNSLDFNLKEILDNVNVGILPDSLNVPGDPKMEKVVTSSGFRKYSVVKSMALEISQDDLPIIESADIYRVENKTHAKHFAYVATQSFGYAVLEETISNLIRNSRIRIYIGRVNDVPASCGMIFLDRNGDSGVHMIGTLPSYRGKGVGRVMTHKLIAEAKNNNSKNVLLVASKLGERIYSKMGFKTYGSLMSFTTQLNI